VDGTSARASEEHPLGILQGLPRARRLDDGVWAGRRHLALGI